MGIKIKTIDAEAIKEEQDVQTYTIVKQTTPIKVVYIDDTRQICEDNFTFRKENPSEKRKENILKKIVCEMWKPQTECP